MYTMASNKAFKICSFNCNGLNNSNKRKDVFDFLRKTEANIFCLQETHLKADIENYIQASWGYKVWLSGCDTNKNGVAILFNNNFEYKIHNVVRDQHGCFIVMNVEFLKKKFTLVNLYGPSSGDKPDFFDSVCEHLENIGNEHVIITGDWNCPMDTTLDIRNYSSTVSRPRTRKKIHDIMTDYNLFDVFREMYPDKRKYTWRKFNSIKQARLDYFLINEELLAMANDVYVNPGYRSDHSIITLALKKDQFKRDRPFWKFNNSLLKDKQYVSEIKTLIYDVKKQYAVPVYNMDNLNNISNDSLFFQIDDQLFFETVLLEIRGKTISYATHKKKKLNEQEADLEKRIKNLEHNLQENDVPYLENLKVQLQEIREHKIQGIAVRSRARWIDQGEKVNKYFCNMENRNFLDKLIPFLETDDKGVISDQESILKEVKQFYTDLYAFQDVTDINIPEELPDAVALSNEDSEAIEGLISFEEAATALKKMKNDKSPGPDGFTVEFF